MDFSFTSEQTQLADSVRRVLEKDYDFERRKAMVRSASGFPDALWDRFVELGLTALPMPEAHDGFGGTAVDLLLVMHEMGRGLVASPYLPTLIAAEFVKRASSVPGEVLQGVAAGTLRLSSALGEPESRHDLFEIRTTALNRTDGFVLSGRKSAVPYGAQADRLVVSARLDNGDLGLFLVDVDPAGAAIERRDARTLDGQHVADIVFNGVAVRTDALLARGDDAVETLDAVTDYAIALLCAEAVGVMDALNAATLEYAKTRKQFGQPIARFQVLQHRMVEMFMHVEQARSMAYLVAARLHTVDGTERRRIASAAKVRIGQAARHIGQQAVQIHGGMGVTDELPAAHLFKRLTMIELTFGDTDHHLQRFIAASAAVASAADDIPAVVPMQRAA